jgi:hypothetical protein
VLRRVNPATPYGNPGCLPLSNPTKCRELGLEASPELADSSAALRDTAPVQSLVHAWPCSAPLQPLLPLPFPAPPLLVSFCARLTFPSLAFLPHLSLPPPDSHMLSWLRCAQFGTFAVLTRGLSAFHLSICLSGGTLEPPHSVLA